MAQSTAGLALRYFFGDILIGTAKFPIWWYTVGLKYVVERCMASIGSMNRTFGVTVWAKNLFVPMYGETSFEGRAISFVMRFFMLMFRSIALALWSVLVFAFFVLYLAVLPASVLGLLYHAGGMIFS
jgi:hypothetical protein